jgi:serpin B
MSRRSYTLSGLLSAVVLLGCSGSPSADQAGNPADPAVARSDVAQTPATTIPEGSLSAAVTANNALAVDLYAHLLAETPPGNLLMSPISASLALTMAYAGAVGTTASEMASALHFDPSLGSAIFDGQNALSQALAARGANAFARARENAQLTNQPAPPSADYDFHVINSIWGEKTYTWERPFLDTIAQSYGTGVYEADFIHAYEPARTAINDWVSRETQAKINGLLPPGSLDEKTRMVLVNAMHLKFPWQSPFEPNQTASGSFTRADATTVTASFMNQTAELAYVDDGRAQIAALPLSNGELSLVIALPHEGTDLGTYEAGLRVGSAALGIPASGERVFLSLPKATFTSPSVSLSSALKSMGMNQAFNQDTADFSGLCAHPPDRKRLYVADVLQKAMIAMQEGGVEAAAATAVVIAGTISIAVEPDPAPVSMVVNRPYLLALVDAPTGAILMLGQVTDPTDAGSP